MKHFVSVELAKVELVALKQGKNLREGIILGIMEKMPNGHV